MEDYEVIDGIAGLGDIDTPVQEEQMDELLGKISRFSPSARRKVAKAMTKRANSATRTVAGSVTMTKNATSKAELQARLSMLPEDIRSGLSNGRLQITDIDLYTARLVGTDTNAELMQNSDVAEAGKANLNQRKLEPNQYFMLTAISLLSGVNADPKAATYGAIPAVCANGDFQLDLGNKVVVPRTAASMFVTGARTDIPTGYYKLDNPKLITPQTEIKPQIWCAGANAGNTCYKVILHGAIITRN